MSSLPPEKTEQISKALAAGGGGCAPVILLGLGLGAAVYPLSLLLG